MTGPSLPRVVVMGVSGVGKTTVGKILADRLTLPFGEGDDFHSEHNIAKMSAGEPLTDADRWSWLEAIGTWLDDHAASGAVVACSALKRSYRDILRNHARDVWFLHLTGSHELLRQRIAGRKGHFMPPSLERSQWQTLEPPGEDEQAITVDVANPPEQVVSQFLTELRRRDAGVAG